MNIIQLVDEALLSHGFDGLVNSEQSCGCSRGDLAPCGEMSVIDCNAAYQSTHSISGESVFSEKKNLANNEIELIVKQSDI